MTLTPTQIQSIEIALSKMGINYYDIRCELTDHIAVVLEEKEGDFDIELHEYLKENKKNLKKINRNMFFGAVGGTYRKFAKQLVSPGFLMAAVVLFAFVMLLKQYVRVEMLASIEFLIYCIVIGITSFMFLIRTFYYRRSFSGGVGFSAACLLILYLSIFMSNREQYISETVVLLYFTLTVIISIAVFITTEKQYRSYKFR